MKKVVYLAPIFLLSFLGKNAMADQVEHVSKLDEALKEEAIAESNIAAQNTTAPQTQANPKISTNLLNTKRDNNSVADINIYTASKIDDDYGDDYDGSYDSSYDDDHDGSYDDDHDGSYDDDHDDNYDDDNYKASPVVINNPAGDKVHVHYVDSNGNSIDNSSHDNDYDDDYDDDYGDGYDYDIDVTETGQGSYRVPKGYSLNNPDGKYTISGGAFILK